MMMMLQKISQLLLLSSISSFFFLPFSAEARCDPGNTACQAYPPVALLQMEDAAVEEICKQTPYPSLCISTLTPFPSKTDSPTAILEMAVKESVNSTEAAQAEATRLISDSSTPASEKPLIADCQEIYSNVVEDLQNAVQAVGNGDRGLLNSLLSGAIDSYEDCDDVFAGADYAYSGTDSVDSPLKGIDERLSHMASNCLAIASLLS